MALGKSRKRTPITDANESVRSEKCEKLRLLSCIDCEKLRLLSRDPSRTENQPENPPRVKADHPHARSRKAGSNSRTPLQGAQRSSGKSQPHPPLSRSPVQGFQPQPNRKNNMLINLISAQPQSAMNQSTLTLSAHRQAKWTPGFPYLLAVCCTPSAAELPETFNRGSSAQRCCDPTTSPASWTPRRNNRCTASEAGPSPAQLEELKVWNLWVLEEDPAAPTPAPPIPTWNGLGSTRCLPLPAMPYPAKADQLPDGFAPDIALQSPISLPVPCGSIQAGLSTPNGLRRARLEKCLNELERILRIRNITGRKCGHLLRRCRRLTDAWREAREAELMDG